MAAVGVLALGLSGSVAQAARPLAVAQEGLQPFGVALSGSAAVWPHTTPRYSTPAEIRIGAPGDSPRILLRDGVTPGQGVEQLPTLASSARQVVVGLTDFVATDETVKVVGGSAWAGPPDAPLQRVRSVWPREWVYSAAVDGDRVALLLADRTRERAPLRLLTLNGRTGLERSRRLARGLVGSVSLAGGYIAIPRQVSRDRVEILVRAIRTWRIKMRVVLHLDSPDVETALRPDGALAIVTGFGPYRAAFVAPGGHLRFLRRRPASFEVDVSPRGAVYLSQAQRGRRLIEAAADGHVRSLTRPIRGLMDFALDGGRAALRTRRCVFVARVPALGNPESCEGA